MADRTSERGGWQGFLEICLKAKGSKELNEWFALFLTPKERRAIAHRYLILHELALGHKTQREIARELRVSIAKITRGSNCLKSIRADFKRVLAKGANF